MVEAAGFMGYGAAASADFVCGGILDWPKISSLFWETPSTASVSCKITRTTKLVAWGIYSDKM